MNTRPLNVAEVLLHAELITRSLDAFAETAPNAIKALGGRDALTPLCEMTCIGPIPRLDETTWERMSREYQDRRDGWA